MREPVPVLERGWDRISFEVAMAYTCSILLSSVTPRDLQVVQTKNGKWHLHITGAPCTIFTPEDSLESFAALGRRILHLCAKEQMMTDPNDTDQAVTPTVPVLSEPATTVEPEDAPPPECVTQADRVH